MEPLTPAPGIKAARQSIAILGAGPSGLVLAVALARRGLHSTVFEQDVHPDIAPRFNPDRSYTIDISGHGLKALRYIDACAEFDDRMIRFKGLRIPGDSCRNAARTFWNSPETNRSGPSRHGRGTTSAEA